MTASRRVHHDPTPAPTRPVHIEPSPDRVGVLPYLATVPGLVAVGMLTTYLIGELR